MSEEYPGLALGVIPSKMTMEQIEKAKRVLRYARMMHEQKSQKQKLKRKKGEK